MALPEFLKWLQTAGGIGAASGAVLSIIMEYWAGWYEALGAKEKRLVFLGLCLVLPFIGAGVAALLGLQVFSVELVWALLWAGFAAFSGGTAMHTVFLP